MNEQVRLEQVGFRYRGAKKSVLQGVSLTVKEGDRILIRGMSGSGKSTLLALMAGLSPEYITGELSGKRELLYRTKGVVLQNPEAQIVTPTVREEIAFALENQGMDPEEILYRVDEMMEALGIDSLADRHPLTLSGENASESPWPRPWF
jgi:energy-coupling factor transporter ATP-binding protein EcfA2